MTILTRITGLNRDLKNQIVKIISLHKKVKKIILFGSRATRQANKTSDIDLAVVGLHLSDADVSLIRDELEENIKTPLKFDVVHFDSLSKESLREDILKEGITLYESKTN